MAASFNEAILWIAQNDDALAGNPDFPLVSESMVADLFGTTTERVCICVHRARAYIRLGQPVPMMKARGKGRDAGR
jgi:hypothetical protein